MRTRGIVLVLAALGAAGLWMVSDTGPSRPKHKARRVVDLRSVSPTSKRKKTRDLADVNAIVLHQTGGLLSADHQGWKKVTAHLGGAPDGTVFLIHPLEAYLFASDDLNRDSIAIEVSGNFEGEPGVYWKPGGGPHDLPAAQAEGVKWAMAYIDRELRKRAGHGVQRVWSHRQGEKGKALDPGWQVWSRVAMPMMKELGVVYDPNFARGGYPHPPSWDGREAAVLDGSLPTGEEMLALYVPHSDQDEHPG